MRLQLAPLGVFQGRTVPEGGRLVGWAALVHALAIPAPVRRPSCVSERHVSGGRREEGTWSVFDKRYWPGDGMADHLPFALRHEALDLLALRRRSFCMRVSGELSNRTCRARSHDARFYTARSRSPRPTPAIRYGNNSARITPERTAGSSSMMARADASSAAS
jgi:hypothetical protein